VFAAGGARCETTLAEVVAESLVETGATIALADGFAGGRAAGMLAAARPETVAGALVAADDDRLAHMLELDGDPEPNAVAAQVARRLGASHGAAILAGSDGAPRLAVAGPDGNAISRDLVFPFDRPRMRTLAAWACLELLRRALGARD